MRWTKLALLPALVAGCNTIAGIAGYHTDDSLGTGGAGGGGSTSTGTSTGTGAGMGGDAGPSDGGLPACTDPDVPLRITVVESKSGAFTGITDTKGLFSFLPVGQTFAQCVLKDKTVLDLRAEPGDPNNAVHDWGICGMGSRCEMTVVAPTVLDVHLQ